MQITVRNARSHSHKFMFSCLYYSFFIQSKTFFHDIHIGPTDPTHIYWSNLMNLSKIYRLSCFLVMFLSGFFDPLSIFQNIESLFSLFWL